MKKEYKFYTMFFGQPISDYGLANGHVDYHCLASAFNHVLSNDIMRRTWEEGFEWDVVNGTDMDEDENYKEFFQFYVIDESGYEILRDYTEEVVYYCEEIDTYIWAVDHFGTAWDYVLTDIKCEKRRRR